MQTHWRGCWSLQHEEPFEGAILELKIEHTHRSDRMGLNTGVRTSEEDAGSFLKWRPVDGDDRNSYSASMNRDADWSPVWGTSTRWGFNEMSHPKGNHSEWLWGSQFQQFLIEFQLMILLIQLLSFKLKLSVIWAPIISIIKLLSQKILSFTENFWSNLWHN